VPRPCWPASMPSRHIAISWLRRSVATPTLGACTCRMPPSRDCGPITRSADAGQGLRAGQKAAWGNTPCHGDVFHIQRQCEGLANTLARLATGATSRRKALQAGIGRTGPRGPDRELATQLALARQNEARANWLARDVRTLVHWLRHDVLVLAGPDLATRQELLCHPKRADSEPRQPLAPPIAGSLQQRQDTIKTRLIIDAAKEVSQPNTLSAARDCGLGNGHKPIITAQRSRLRSACFCASCAAFNCTLVYIKACVARSWLSSQRLRQIPRMPSSGWPTTRDEKDSKVIGP